MDTTVHPYPPSRYLRPITPDKLTFCREHPTLYAIRAATLSRHDLADILPRLPESINPACLTTIVNCLALMPIERSANERHLPLSYFTDAFNLSFHDVVHAAHWLSEHTDCYDTWDGMVSRITTEEECRAARSPEVRP